MKAKKNNPQENPAEWFKIGDGDFKTAKIAFEGGGAMYTIAVLLQQTVEKYLKGFLISKGWKLKKTHDLVMLLDEAINCDESFKEFLDLARNLTACYIEDRYPYSMQIVPSSEEVANFIKQVELLISKIKK